MSVIKVIATNFNCLQEVWPAVKIKKKKKNLTCKGKVEMNKRGHLPDFCLHSTH